VNWDILRSVQKQADTRLIYPFGLSVRVGDVIRIGAGGGFSIEGSTQSLLGVPIPSADQLRTGTPGDRMWTSGKRTKLTFYADLKASSELLKSLPDGSAGFGITFESRDSWLLALTGRSLLTFDQVDTYRRAILDAYKRGVWQEDWALVTEVAYAEMMTFLASKFNNTKAALALSGRVDANLAADAQLTAGASVAYTSSELDKWITEIRGPVGCRGLRIQDRLFRRTKVGDLEAAVAEEVVVDVADAPYDEVWQDVDAERLKAVDDDAND
jgi:hypothetical protein